jgi:hypothetical protein
MDETLKLDRREFGAIALGAAALIGSAAKGEAAVHAVQPGIKLCVQAPAKPTADDLLFLQQLGAEYVSVGSTPDLCTAGGIVILDHSPGMAGARAQTSYGFAYMKALLSRANA